MVRSGGKTGLRGYARLSLKVVERGRYLFFRLKVLASEHGFYVQCPINFCSFFSQLEMGAIEPCAASLLWFLHQNPPQRLLTSIPEDLGTRLLTDTFPASPD